MEETYTTEFVVSGLLILVGLLVWHWSGESIDESRKPQN